CCFGDVFTNLNDVKAIKKALLFLEKLGYEVIIPTHEESGRSFLSKGFVREAQKLAIKNVEALYPLISEETPLIGIEPSAILTFRDEYPELVPEHLRDLARKLGENALLFEEFISREFESKRI